MIKSVIFGWANWGWFPKKPDYSWRKFYAVMLFYLNFQME